MGNSPKAVLAFEEWLDRPVDFVRAHTGRGSWWDYDSSIGWVGSQLQALNKPINWTIPMFAFGGNLAEAASGAYDDHYVKAAQSILKTRSVDEKIFVRFGEEFNGGWMPWAAKGKEGDFIQTYRNMVDAFRSVSDKFVFEWNVNVGHQGMDPAKAYPGDAYVDVIGMDFYLNTAWDPKDPLAAWDYMVKRDYGLQWLESFAAQHGKPTAYAEWGIKADNAAPYITKAAEWFQSHNVLYQSYWDDNNEMPSKISDGSNPQNAAEAAAYKAAFGKAPAETGPNTAPVATSDTYILDENTTLKITAGGVLANDRDADGDALSAMLVTQPTNGKLTLNPNGSFSYTPDPNFSGTDSFTYVARDAKVGSTPTKVTLNVLETDDAAVSGTPLTWAVGTAGNDVMTGNTSNNSLDGSTGTDTLTGKGGDDTYVVDRAEDRVIEASGEGIDTVKSYAITGYALSANVENLMLMNGNQFGTGNALSNGIAGSAGNNVLNGKAGNDWLTGGAGSDTFVFERGTGHDTIRDFVTSGTGQDVVKLVGFDYASFAQLRSAMSQDGADTLLKLSDGSSVTFLNHKVSDFTAGDLGFTASAPTSPTLPEQPSTPNQPEVPASPTQPSEPASPELPVFRPERPAESDRPVTWRMGTNSNETMIGTSANNVLKGGGGEDALKGGKGDDTYDVDNAGDIVVEKGGEGIDTVEAWISHTLSANVENLMLLGQDLTGTGNGLANLIVGGEGNDVLNGKAGNDWLTGSRGADTFVFEKGTDHDVITDFVIDGFTHDVVDLTSFGYSDFSQVQALLSQSGSDTLLSLPDGSHVTYLNHFVSQFTAGNFVL